MSATQLGTSLIVSVSNVGTTYITESITSGDKDVYSEDIRDENGVLATRVVMQAMPKITLNLICKTGANPSTDFPVGAKCTVSGYTSYYVDSLSIVASEKAQRVTVNMTNIGL